MTIETLRDYLEGKSIFSEIETVSGSEFPFIGADATILDSMLVIDYGDRRIFPPYVDFGITDVAKILVKTFREQWNDYLTIEATKENLNVRKETTETINNSEDRTNATNSVNKVAGFNASTMVDNDSAETNLSEEVTGEKTRTTTDEHINPELTFTLLNSSAKATIINSVVKDVAGKLTLEIY